MKGRNKIMIMNGKDYVLECASDSIYKSSMDNAKRHNTLCHYTNFKALKHIFNERRLKFNCINNVNDFNEGRYFVNNEIANTVFVSCFSHERYESIPMWFIYGKNKSSIRIKFEFKKNNIDEIFFDHSKETCNSSGEKIEPYECGGCRNDLSYSTSIHDVVYNEAKLKQHPIFIDHLNKYNISSMGIVKRKIWDYERETRFILRIVTVKNNINLPDITCFFLPLNFSAIKRVTITFNPWISDYMEKVIRRFFEINKHSINLPVTFEDSALKGTIKK